MKNWYVIMLASEKLASGFVFCARESDTGIPPYQVLWNERHGSNTRIAAALRSMSIPPLAIFPCGSDGTERDVAVARFKAFVMYWQSRGGVFARYNAAAALSLGYPGYADKEFAFNFGDEKTNEYERAEFFTHWLGKLGHTPEFSETHGDWWRVVQGLGDNAYFQAVRPTSANPWGDD